MKKRFSVVLSGFSFLCMVGSLTCREGSLKGVGGFMRFVGRLIDENLRVHLSEQKGYLHVMERSVW